ncbi:hypothetical protein J1N35_013437 [Gossypium stocksii]|uniref:F-box domain-containing protein n=1 Tax=Gossypium stocksii TaxID=47602 RepID=A0A9D4A8U8_9ROSI|nr:hypothetical protein J1N35_013437 [Gossypium stocksii]
MTISKNRVKSSFMPVLWKLKEIVTSGVVLDTYLACMTVVSGTWRHFVIRNDLCKHLSLQMFPQLSRVDHVNKLGGSTKGHSRVGSSNFMEWEALEREHRAYAFLARYCLSTTAGDCISEATIASSTDNYP